MTTEPGEIIAGDGSRYGVHAMILEESTQLPSAPASAATARRMVQRVAATALSAEMADTATLLVSELVSNAVLHARTEITVTVRLEDLLLRVEVCDESPSVPRTKTYSEFSATGRGLRLVDQLSSRWGVEISPPGKSVWFELVEQTVAGESETMGTSAGKEEGPTPASAAHPAASSWTPDSTIDWAERAGTFGTGRELVAASGRPLGD